MSHSRRLLLARMANTREDLEEVLDRIDDRIMDWAPVAGMRTISGQMVEIAATEIQVRGRLKKSVWISDDEIRASIGDLGSIGTMRAFLRAVRSETVAQIEEYSDEELEGDAGFRLGAGGYVVDWFPRSEVFRKLIEHEAYHVGQLVSYVWAYGDDPYRWDLSSPVGPE